MLQQVKLSLLRVWTRFLWRKLNAASNHSVPRHKDSGGGFWLYKLWHGKEHHSRSFSTPSPASSAVKKQAWKLRCGLWIFFTIYLQHFEIFSSPTTRTLKKLNHRFPGLWNFFTTCSCDFEIFLVMCAPREFTFVIIEIEIEFSDDEDLKSRF